MLYDIDNKAKALVIINNIPPGTEVGIDYHVWTAGPTFKGIANIPPGLHFIFFSFVNKKHDETSARTGFYLFLQGGDVVTKYYDSTNEDIKDDTSTNCTISHLKEVGKYLAPYPSNECEKWFLLTECITKELFERVQPSSGKINYLTTVPVDSADKHLSWVMNVDSRIDNTPDQNSIIRFTKIPLKLQPGLTPSEVTKHSMDSSYTLESIIKVMKNGENELLGELQFAFVTFLIGQVYDSFEHWKLLVSILTNCQDSLSSRSFFFLKFIDIIQLQVEEIPEDYFVDIVAQNNFLRKTFSNFFLNFEEPAGVNGDLLKKVSIFKHYLGKTFQWEFEDENLPVVVEL